MPLGQRPARRLANCGECLRQDIVELLFFREAFAELRCPRAQGIVGEGFGLVLERVDLLDDLPESSELALVGVEEPRQAAQVAIAR